MDHAGFTFEADATGEKGHEMETQIERRRRTLTAEDVSALVDALEVRAMDRLQKTVGRTVFNLAFTWALRLLFLVIVYSAGAAGVLRRILPS